MAESPASAATLETCLKLLQAPLDESSQYAYLISSKYLQNLRSQASENENEIDAIDNSVLIDEENVNESILRLENADRFIPPLKAGLVRNSDFVVVSEAAWKATSQLFGGGPEIKRRCIRLSDSTPALVEIYPSFITIHGNKTSVTIEASRTDKIASLVDVAAPKLGFSLPLPENIRCINYLAQERGETLDFNATVAECGLETKQDLLLDVVSAPGDSNHASRIKLSIARGLVNVSNSCYVNSSVQALSHVPLLRSYLAPDSTEIAPYVAEINTENVMGHKGVIAAAFADVVSSMYSAELGKTDAPVLPRSLLKVIGKLSSRFASMEQQDAQELLSALLDGVHEDVNRIKGRKPYHPDPVETDSKDENILKMKSIEAWKRHLERDDSFIVDNFHGQLQSEVCCSECGKSNIRWEPFSSLVLPLPLDNSRPIRPLLVGFPHLTVPTYVDLTLDRRSTVSDLVAAALESSDFPSISKSRGDFVVSDLYSNRVHKIFNSTEKITSISSSDLIGIYFVKHPPVVSAALLNYVLMPVVQRCVRPSWNAEKSTHELQGRPCGIPLFIPFPVGVHQVSRSLLELIAKQYLENVAIGSEVSTRPFTLSIIDRQVRTIHPVVDTVRISRGQPQEHKLAYPANAVITIPVDGKQSHECLSLDWDLSVKDGSILQQKFATVSKKTTTTPSAETSSSGLSLTKCLHMFTKVEQLDSNNAWNCVGCKKQRAASKVFSISKLPKVLVISLKRFSADPWGSQDTSVLSALIRSKLTHVVDFPIHGLDLSPFLAPYAKADDVTMKYNLVAVVNHYGNAIGGHYTAYCKEADGAWYLFDDNHVSKVSESNLVSSAAYVLVYSCDPAS
eukprot:TRINITY_DN11394_c0_g1_i1.p1 TRINITY_DN11394_c0_g1~~TRINITY_DN11394_c0_g1_i1.p1  ORF type:complete len:850 (-),score=142.54 TRINITY_DN11394_c0_g1_i1:1487-4036(-)